MLYSGLMSGVIIDEHGNETIVHGAPGPALAKPFERGSNRPLLIWFLVLLAAFAAHSLATALHAPALDILSAVLALGAISSGFISCIFGLGQSALASRRPARR